MANLSNHSFFFRRKASGRTRGSENTRRPTRASKAPRESNDRKSAVPVQVFLRFAMSKITSYNFSVYKLQM